MPTRNVVLSDHQHHLVESLVSSGRYQNASEVLRDGLRLIEQREREEAAKLHALRLAADIGWADVANGRVVEVEVDVVVLGRVLHDSMDIGPHGVE
ncbi:type II toxin-antitoxin system ParD family antitoxin [Tessaracoccus caeni]|uniref:type II toxin-antitoxin system ParD family antitoxin n=1 Tax=Tessaracoccus caeni TaxID=3031239 RepID=UPI0023DBD232|nr:type II toxin-antitoxin system ParD family antitoxin [Tessaracoccus caeni]MDF1488069.1 type II toxin-antitoxin system ParD family antitoxin [Tessaracoccus caeni]